MRGDVSDWYLKEIKNKMSMKFVTQRNSSVGLKT